MRPPNIVCESAAMKRVLEEAKSASEFDVTCLITGESGTGKELIAKYIHCHSKRADGAFISINCAAINDNLIESELFGHMKGSFTDAREHRVGKLEQAKNGTLFLDEIGSMSHLAQGRLLRVLQDGSFYRVGGDSQVFTNARVIAATNVDMPKLIEEGSFRADLFHRLNVYDIHIPPLRDRRGDIKPLVNHFLQKYNLQFGIINSRVECSASLLSQISNMPWPGNVRQLENLIQKMIIKNARDLRDRAAQANGFFSTILFDYDLDIEEDRFEYSSEYKDAMDEFEKKILLENLKKTAWNVRQAAKVLGIHRNTLMNRMDKLKIRRHTDDIGDR